MHLTSVDTRRCCDTSLVLIIIIKLVPPDRRSLLPLCVHIRMHRFVLQEIGEVPISKCYNF
jgi:hypothetical protein